MIIRLQGASVSASLVPGAQDVPVHTLMVVWDQAEGLEENIISDGGLMAVRAL